MMASTVTSPLSIDLSPVGQVRVCGPGPVSCHDLPSRRSPVDPDMLPIRTGLGSGFERGRSILLESTVLLEVWTGSLWVI